MKAGNKWGILRGAVIVVLLVGVGCVQRGVDEDALESVRSVEEELVFVDPDIRLLDMPALYDFSEWEHDPLKDVAEEIRPQIDPAGDERWPDRFKRDYVEHIKNIQPEYERFWERIPVSARRYVDLFNDGTPEYVVISDGLNAHFWGFKHFMAVLHRPPDERGYRAEQWEILYLRVFDRGPSEMPDRTSGRLRLRGLKLIVTDLDRNGRSNVLITTLQAGASGQTYSLDVLSIGRDMSFVRHTLPSSEPIEVLGTDELRPVFVTRFFDRTRGTEPMVGARNRGYRKYYHRWTVDGGFLQF